MNNHGALCPVPGCPKTQKTCGYCARHYHVWKETQNVEEVISELMRYGYDLAVKRKRERVIYCNAVLSGVIQPVAGPGNWRASCVDKGLIGDANP